MSQVQELPKTIMVITVRAHCHLLNYKKHILSIPSVLFVSHTALD